RKSVRRRDRGRTRRQDVCRRLSISGHAAANVRIFKLRPQLFMRNLQGSGLPGPLQKLEEVVIMIWRQAAQTATIDFYGESNIGPVRPVNADAFLAAPVSQLPDMPARHDRIRDSA